MDSHSDLELMGRFFYCLYHGPSGKVGPCRKGGILSVLADGGSESGMWHLTDKTKKKAGAQSVAVIITREHQEPQA